MLRELLLAIQMTLTEPERGPIVVPNYGINRNAGQPNSITTKLAGGRRKARRRATLTSHETNRKARVRSIVYVDRMDTLMGLYSYRELLGWDNRH